LPDPELEVEEIKKGACLNEVNKRKEDAMKIMSLGKMPRKVTAGEIAELEKPWNRYASPGTRVEVAFPDDFEGSQVWGVLAQQKIQNGLDHIMEAPSLIRKIVWAAENGYDAVVQSNTFDPGIDGARLSVSIPVIGPFRTTIHIVANLVDRIGIVVPLPSHVPYTWRLLRTMAWTGSSPASGASISTARTSKKRSRKSPAKRPS